MLTKSNNDSIISEYLSELSNKKIDIPYITVISKDTGISNSTISRYARRIGYYNFGDMRASFNKKNKDKVANLESKGLEYIYKYDNIKIISSKSTKTIGEFLKKRLEFIGNVELGLEKEKCSKNDLVIYTTISGESKKITDAIKNCIGNKILITTLFNKTLSKDIRQVVINEHAIKIRNSYDVSNAIVNIIVWLNERINIEEKRIKNNIKK